MPTPSRFSAGDRSLAPLPLYADESLLVFDKPSGLLSVPGRGLNDCLSERVRTRFEDALVVHRLDMATSGLMVFGRGAAAQRALSKAFAEREVRKRYVAVVHGSMAQPEAEWGMIDLPIIVDWPNRPLRIVDPILGKPSLTRWRVLARHATADSSRVELEPVTGRSHQLRVHLRELGHPILGDRLYAPPAVQQRAPRLLLHACELGLRHPATGVWLSFASPVPF
jgi:tRNA pseudouridine32 synthase/23S rRNA pseudouridine746 synthase